MGIFACMRICNHMARSAHKEARRGYLILLEMEGPYCRPQFGCGNQIQVLWEKQLVLWTTEPSLYPVGQMSAEGKESVGTIQWEQGFQHVGKAEGEMKWLQNRQCRTWVFRKSSLRERTRRGRGKFNQIYVCASSWKPVLEKTYLD